MSWYSDVGNHVVILSLCTDYDGIVVQTGAELRFHNPYGWLPASWYGQVVTTGLVFAFCIILDLIFIFLFCKYVYIVDGQRFSRLLVLAYENLFGP